MNPAWGQGHMIQPGPAGHAGVAAGILRGHAALISPEDVKMLPVHLLPERRLGQDFISPPGSLPSGKGHTEGRAEFYRLFRLPGKKFSRSPAQGFLVRIGLDDH